MKTDTLLAAKSYPPAGWPIIVQSLEWAVSNAVTLAAQIRETHSLTCDVDTIATRLLGSALMPLLERAAILQRDLANLQSAIASGTEETSK